MGPPIATLVALLTLSHLLSQPALGFQMLATHRSPRASGRGRGGRSPVLLGSAPPERSDDGDPRDNLGRMMRGVLSTGMKDTVDRSDVVVAKVDVPSLGIYTDQTYELRSIYLQGLNADTESVERIPLDTLNDDRSIPGYTRYIRLFSPAYHDEPVVVTPEEVGLVSLRDEVVDSVLVALPILSFWIGTCLVFAGKYNERYGGNFVDALFGR